MRFIILEAGCNICCLYIRGIIIAVSYQSILYPSCNSEGTEKHTIFILTLIKKKKSIRVFMILVDFLLGEI